MTILLCAHGFIFTSSYKIDYVEQVEDTLNPAGHQNPGYSNLYFLDSQHICFSVNLKNYLFFDVQLETICLCWQREALTLEFKKANIPQFGQQSHSIFIRYDYGPKITHLQFSCSSLDKYVRRCLTIEQKG